MDENTSVGAREFGPPAKVVGGIARHRLAGLDFDRNKAVAQAWHSGQFENLNFNLTVSVRYRGIALPAAASSLR